MKSAKAILGILLVFCLGAGTGMVATHMYYKPMMERFIRGGPEMREEMLVRRLTGKLDLDGRQVEQVRVIVRETHTEMEQFRQLQRPRVEAILEKGQARINQLLRPEQQAKYAQLIAERKKRHPMP